MLTSDQKRQSNSRLVRWSDGSVSLQLGSDLYDLAPSYGTTLARPTDPPPKNPLPEKPPGANSTFLAIASVQDEVLMTENAIAGQVSLVPASSSSKTHIELVKHVGQQHVKHSRMKVMDDIVDPENTHVAAANAKKRTTRGAGGGGGAGGRARKLKRDSSDDDDDPRYTFDTDNPSRGTRGGQKGYEAEYDEDDGFVVADSDEDGEGELDEDEEDGDGNYGGGSSKKSSSKRKSNKAKKRKGSVESLDEMEEMERRIEASEREKKRARKNKKEKSRRDYDTDEDDEEEPAAVSQQPTAAARAKSANGEEEEEDMEMDIESEED